MAQVAPMIAAVDIGNTRAKFGLFKRQADGQVHAQTIEAFPLSTDQQLRKDLRAWSERHRVQQDVSELLVAGSNPDLRSSLTSDWPITMPQPNVIQDYRRIPIEHSLDFPERTGIDRLLNACAAKHYSPGTRPLIIVDSGTATTVDLMTADGIFRGGSILPGLRLSARALHDYTARLPLLDVDESILTMPQVPGTNTTDAILSGLFLGQLGAVREIVQRLQIALRQQWQETREAGIIVTGGGGRQIAGHLPESRYIDSLALCGLATLASV